MGRIVWCARPKLRTQDSGANAVNELLFDLVFAASVATLAFEMRTVFALCDSQVACVLSEHLSSLMLLFWPFWHVALQLAQLANRFRTEEFVYNLFMYGLIGCVVALAVHATGCSTVTVPDAPLGPSGSGSSSGSGSGSGSDGVLGARRLVRLVPGTPGTSQQVSCKSIFTSDEDNFRWFAVAASISQVLVGVQFFRMRVSGDRALLWCVVHGTGCLLAAAVWMVASALDLPPMAQRAAVITTVTVHIIAEAITRLPSITLPTALPDHLSRRMRKFCLVMLAQVILGVVQPDDNYTTEGFVAVAGFLTLTFVFKVSYFDVLAGHSVGFTRPVAFCEMVWTLSNYVLALSLTTLGASAGTIVHGHNLKLDASFNVGLTIRLRELLCVSTASVVISTSLIQLSLRGAGSRVRRWRKRYRVVLRVFFGLAIAALATVPPTVVPNYALVWMIVGIMVVSVCADMYGQMRKSNIEADRKRRQLKKGLLDARRAINAIERQDTSRSIDNQGVVALAPDDLLGFSGAYGMTYDEEDADGSVDSPRGTGVSGGARRRSELTSPVKGSYEAPAAAGLHPDRTSSPDGGIAGNASAVDGATDGAVSREPSKGVELGDGIRR